MTHIAVLNNINSYGRTVPMNDTYCCLNNNHVFVSEKHMTLIYVAILNHDYEHNVIPNAYDIHLYFTFYLYFYTL